MNDNKLYEYIMTLQNTILDMQEESRLMRGQVEMLNKKLNNVEECLMLESSTVKQHLGSSNRRIIELEKTVFSRNFSTNYK